MVPPTQRATVAAISGGAVPASRRTDEAADLLHVGWRIGVGDQLVTAFTAEVGNSVVDHAFRVLA